MTVEAFKEIYELLTARVLPVAQNLGADPAVYGVQRIEFMDIWHEQLNREDERIEAYPAIFWEFSGAYNTDGLGRRKATESRQSLTARLVFQNTDFIDTDLNRIEGTGFLNVAGMSWLATKEAVRDALHGHSGAYVKNIIVGSERLETGFEGLTVVVFEMEATVYKSECV